MDRQQAIRSAAFLRCGATVLDCKTMTDETFTSRVPVAHKAGMATFTINSISKAKKAIRKTGSRNCVAVSGKELKEYRNWRVAEDARIEAAKAAAEVSK